MQRFLQFMGTAAIVVGAALFASVSVSAGPIEDAFGKHAKGSAVTVDHTDWDTLLKSYVQAGADGLNRVDYLKFKAESHQKLKAYVVRLEAVDVARLDRPEQFAFWANLYNARTVDIVLDKYPVASIKDISLGGGVIATLKGGPWKAKVVRVAGQDLSLDDIEHGILRGLFKDPRVHYAVNCASVGCPNLPRTAFTGARLEAMLEEGARAYVNSPRGAVVVNGKLRTSNIYNWFQTDFGGNERGVIDHVERYANPELKNMIGGTKEVGEFAYDWRLNDIKR